MQTFQSRLVVAISLALEAHDALAATILVSGNTLGSSGRAKRVAVAAAVIRSAPWG